MTFIKKKKKNFWGGENIRDKLVPNPHLSHKETEEERENIICFQHHWLLVKKLGLEPTDLASENMHVSGFFTQHCVQLWGGNPQKGELSGIMWSSPALLSSLTSCWQDSPLSFHMDLFSYPSNTLIPWWTCFPTVQKALLLILSVFSIQASAQMSS